METTDLSHIWPGWVIEGPALGSGSFGSVYKAVRRDSLVESSAAVKIISIPKFDSEIDSLRADGLDTYGATTYLQGIVNNCVSEIQLMTSLKGIQNIVSVEDYKIVRKTDRIGWDIYIRMELLTPLTTYVANHPLSEQEVIKLGCDICTALEVCSKRGIIHRDIKPENIFVNDFGDFKLGDFGIARTLEGQMSDLSRKGTPNYMAPEVANSKDYDTRVDTYSLGVVLYRFLNRNRLPFLDTEEQLTNPVERANASARRLRGEKLPRPSQASSKLADVVLKACAYNPNARYQDASQMKQALEDVRRNPTKKRRRPGRAIAVIAFLAILLGGLGTLYANGMLTDIVEELKVQIPRILNLPESTDPEEYAQISAILDDADELIRDKNFAGAISVLEAALANYPNSRELEGTLESCRTLLEEQTKKNTLANAQALADQEDYVGAIALLQDAIAQQGQVPEYISACERLQAECDNAARERALAQADQYIADGDYLNAISTLKGIISAMGENNELIQQIKDLENTYITQAIKKADSLVLVEEYDRAEEIMAEVLENFPDDELVRSEAARIRHARPAYLLDEVAPYKKTGYFSVRNSLYIGDKYYDHGFTCMGYGDYNKGNQTFFNLDGNYSMISFTAGVISDHGQRVNFFFYADGELVYKFSMVGRDKPSNHVFNISGCRQLQICVYDGCSTSDNSGTYALMDIVVTRSEAALGKEPVRLTSNQVYLMDETKPYITPNQYEDSNTFSMGGQNFANGFTTMGYGDYKVGNMVYFNLGQRYSQMTFTAGIVVDLGLDVTYRFYTDGTLAYELTLGESDLAQTHTFSVEDCRQLQVCIYDGRKNADASGTYGIAEIIMDKSSTYTEQVNTEVPLSDGESYLLSVLKPHTAPTRYNDKDILNMGGNRYSNGFSCMGYGYKGNETIFDLGGKYQELSFTAGIILDRGHKVTFRFLLDGKQIYEFTMGKGDLPTDHTIPVAGGSELVIAVIDRQQGADSSGTYGLANIIVKE